MTDRADNPSRPGEPDKTGWLIAGGLAGILMTIGSLEYYGYLKHPAAEDSARIEEFVLLELNQAVDIKVSNKESGKLAFCSDGYLLMRPDNNKPVAGILVDGKKRPVRCKSSMTEN